MNSGMTMSQMLTLSQSRIQYELWDDHEPNVNSMASKNPDEFLGS